MAQLIVGNTARQRADKRWAWVLYVRGATEHVKDVTVKLHPTFKKNVRRAEAEPFEVSAVGYGTFDIDVTIRWKVGGEMYCCWPLQFDQPDASSAVDIPPEVLSAAAAAAAGNVASAVGEILDSSSDEGEALDDGSETEDPAQPALPTEPPALLRETSPGAEAGDHERDEITKRLRATGFMKSTDPLFKFGRGYTGPMQDPKVTWKSDKPPRKDHSCPKWLTATEFEDERAVMAAKVKQLAQLIRLSRKTVAYTGAGISAAVIGQAALSGQNKVGWKTDLKSAPPTFTHHALGFLGREGLVHGWVQQNHDGLPQRAGYPQERINEIHGSWFDPSNPVVKYSGTLHERSYPWMRDDAETADLVLVLGTSLGGLNADQVATKAADRSLLPPGPAAGTLAPGAWLKTRPPGMAAEYRGLVTAVEADSIMVRFAGMEDSDSEEDGDGLSQPVRLPRTHPIRLTHSCAGGLGTVCINLQQTPQDGKMTLRMFGKSDDILRALLQELGFKPEVKPVRWPTVHRVLVPYDADGRRIPEGSKRKMWLDLRKGQPIRITPGHNIQGAKQPMYMHIGATQPYTTKTATRQPGVGIGSVREYDAASTSFLLSIEGVQMRLGVWWLESATRGGVEVLPIVNRDPQFAE